MLFWMLTIFIFYAFALFRCSELLILISRKKVFIHFISNSPVFQAITLFYGFRNEQWIEGKYYVDTKLWRLLLGSNGLWWKFDRGFSVHSNDKPNLKTHHCLWGIYIAELFPPSVPSIAYAMEYGLPKIVLFVSLLVLNPISYKRKTTFRMKWTF